MKSSKSRRIWAIIAGLVIFAGAAFSRELPLRAALEDSIPGPGPNRLDARTSGTYELGVGDLLSVAITFKPESAKSQLIQPGDRLFAAYHFSTLPSDKAYRVEPGDQVALEFRYSPELSQLYTVSSQTDKISVLSKPYTVQSDGTLVLTGLNEPVKVMGKTAGEIARIVREKYKGMLKIPDVTVAVEPQYLYHKSLLALVQPLEEKQKTTLYSAVPHLYLTVPPDGILTLPLLPKIPAAGQTIQQVSEEITRRYRALNFYLVTVNLLYDKIADETHEQLRALLNEKNNPIHCEVLEGGQIALPLIRNYRVAGKSLDKISEELTALYHEKGLGRVEATAWVEKPRSRVVRVMGEVQAPGVYAIHGSADLWGMIALAGGFTPEADPSAVRIIKTGERPCAAFSFNKYLETGDPAADPLVSGDELIVVAKKK